MEIFRLFGSIFVKTDEAKKGIDEVDNKAKNLHEKLGSLGDRAIKVGDKMASFGSNLLKKTTLPIVGAGTASLKFASDLSENMNKAESVFGKNADAVKKWSEGSIEKMGMAKSTALDMVSKFGDMGTSMGLPIDKSAEMSEKMVQLGADLASFKNIGLDQASTALTGIFTGETESLKGLGIVMTQTNLEQFAMSHGIKKNIKDMSEAEKVQLRYAYVMDKTKNAQGDFKKTNGEFAGQMRMLKESVKELGASIGQKLIPQVLPLFKKANTWIQDLSKMDDKTKNLIITIAKWVAGIAPALIVGGKAISFITKFNKSIVNTVKFMKNLPSNTKKVVTHIKDFNKHIGNGVKNIAKFSKSIGKATFTKFTNGLKLVGNGAKTAGNHIATFAKNVALTTKNIAKAGFTKLANGLKLVGKGALSAGKHIATFAKNVALAGLNAAKTTISFIAQKTALIAHKVATIASTIAQKALNLVMSMNPIVLLVTLITGLVAWLVHLYKTNDKARAIMDKAWKGLKNTIGTVVKGIKNVVTSAWNGIKNVTKTVWNGIKMLIINPIKGAVNFVKGAVNKIKGFFSGMHIKLPHIKLPHFRLKGEFSLKKLSVPHLGVDWYSEGGIFTRPTILGGIGVGDANKGQGSNAEAVLPLNVLWEELRKNFEMLSKQMGDNGLTIEIKEMNVRNEDDIDKLAEKLEFYRKQNNLGRGGAY